MALIVEDGTGKSTANAYVSLADLLAYFEERYDLVMAEQQEDEALEGAILYATRDIDQSFKFDGYKKSLDQALAWPRIGAYDKEENAIAGDVVPVVVVQACCERAREHLLTRALNDPVDPKQELTNLSVGPLSLAWNTQELSSMPENRFYLNLLRGLFVGGSISREIVRA